MRIIRAIVIVVASLVVAAAAAVAWFVIGSAFHSAEQLQQLVAVSWGDGKYGKAIYGAYVFYEPQDNGQLQVKLRVQIYRGSAWFQYANKDRTLGLARDPADAVDKWGVINWSDAGITVGRPGYAYLFPRAELDRHR